MIAMCILVSLLFVGVSPLISVLMIAALIGC